MGQCVVVGLRATDLITSKRRLLPPPQRQPANLQCQPFIWLMTLCGGCCGKSCAHSHTHKQPVGQSTDCLCVCLTKVTQRYFSTGKAHKLGHSKKEREQETAKTDKCLQRESSTHTLNENANCICECKILFASFVWVGKRKILMIL